MLNIDKHKKEILKEIENHKKVLDENKVLYRKGINIYIKSVEEIMKKYDTEPTGFYDDDIKWLFSEYEEPPTLKNGDNLKPGDWIMVRDFDDQDWYKAQFMCYLNNEFCVAYGGLPIDETHIFTSWSQARLPEKGE